MTSPAEVGKPDAHMRARDTTRGGAVSRAIITERNATRRQIEHVCAQLAEAVFRLASDGPRPPEGDRKSTDRR
ncbi:MULTISPECIES: hypothetical protein [Streptomyces]|uniref:hypothetical protein n=1 Tax=Streptomyces TaxID=1883 RepID=UPI0031F74279